MTAPIVQAEYEQLKQIATKFGQLGDRVSSLQQQLNQQHQRLADGGWEGAAFKAFDREYTGEVVPTLKRLENAFNVAQSLTGEISKVFRQAEEEAAALFKGNLVATVDKGKKDEGSWWSKTWGKASEWVHGGLDVLGFIPGFGEIADGANALIYLAEGRYAEAAISAAAMIPIVGDAGKIGKWGVKAGKEVMEAGGERLVKEIAQEGSERLGKNASRLGQEGGIARGIVPDDISRGEMKKLQERLKSATGTEVVPMSRQAQRYGNHFDPQSNSIHLMDRKPNRGMFYEEVQHALDQATPGLNDLPFPGTKGNELLHAGTFDRLADNKWFNLTPEQKQAFKDQAQAWRDKWTDPE